MSADSDEIDRKAADWAAKREFRTLSAEENAAFEAWLKADTRHLGAFGRAVAALVRLKDAYSAAPEGTVAIRQPVWSRRGFVLAGSMAACIAVVTVGTQLWKRGAHREEYATSIGQVREIVLADRSIVTLNTNSKIAVEFTEDARTIHLLEGEAHFDVAKNKQRPFVVWAGATSVRAVGTSFTVSVLPQHPTEILVKEGVVEVKRADAQVSPVRAGANTKVIAAPKSDIVIAPVPQETLVRYTAWQSGRVAFEDETLADAAAEFARYSEVRITVDDDVANKRITGMFVSSDPIGFAKATASALDLDVEVGAKQVRIFNRSEMSR
jgi:transmembrane sensor